MKGIITYEGVKYRKKLLKAVDGDKVVIIDVQDLNRDGYKLGDIFNVEGRWEDGIDTANGVTLLDSEYAVLEQIGVVAPRPDVTGLIANLGRRVHELEGADAVNSPKHYTQGDIEVIDYIDQVADGYEGKQAVYAGNIIKYVSRAPYKNQAQDIRKAIWYAQRLADAMEAEASE